MVKKFFQHISCSVSFSLADADNDNGFFNGVEGSF
jgi:hypothetical protein